MPPRTPAAISHAASPECRDRGSYTETLFHERTRTHLRLERRRRALGAPPFRIQFDDETLRDGLQSPSVTNPAIDEKIRILHLMERLGHRHGRHRPAGRRAARRRGRTRLAQEIATRRLKIQPNCAARTLRQDITPVVEISQKVGIPIEVCTFIGSSPDPPVRRELDARRRCCSTPRTRSTFAVAHGLPVMYVTEDTVRAQPETLRQLFLDRDPRRREAPVLVRHGRPRDARPAPRNLVRFARRGRARERSRRSSSTGTATRPRPRR